AGVLDARSGRAAEGEHQRGNQRAACVPAAVAEKQDDADPTEEEVGKGHRISRAEAGIRGQRGKKKVQGREDQGLRVGDLRPAREHVGGPERQLASGQRSGEELKLRQELRLRVPRNGDAAREPWPSEHKKGGGEDEDGKAKP